MLQQRARVVLGKMTIKGFFTSPKAPAFLGLTVRLFSVISWTLVRRGESYLSAEKQLVYSAVGVFCNPSWLVYTCRGKRTSLKRCSRCILQPQPTGLHSLGESYLSEEMQSVYSAAPADWATLVGGVLTLCRDTVGVSYSPGRLGYTRWGSLNSMQRYSWCILQPRPTGLHSLGES